MEKVTSEAHKLSAVAVKPTGKFQAEHLTAISLCAQHSPLIACSGLATVKRSRGRPQAEFAVKSVAISWCSVM